MIRAPLSGLQWGDTLECLPPSAGEGQTDRLPSEGLPTRRQRHSDGPQTPTRTPAALAHGRGEQGGPAAVSAPVGTEDRAALRAPRGSAGVLALVNPFSPLPAMTASRRGSARPGWGALTAPWGRATASEHFGKPTFQGLQQGLGAITGPRGSRPTAKEISRHLPPPQKANHAVRLQEGTACATHPTQTHTHSCCETQDSENRGLKVYIADKHWKKISLGGSRTARRCSPRQERGWVHSNAALQTCRRKLASTHSIIQARGVRNVPLGIRLLRITSAIAQLWTNNAAFPNEPSNGVRNSFRLCLCFFCSFEQISKFPSSNDPPNTILSIKQVRKGKKYRQQKQDADSASAFSAWDSVRAAGVLCFPVCSPRYRATPCYSYTPPPQNPQIHLGLPTARTKPIQEFWLHFLAERSWLPGGLG